MGIGEQTFYLRFEDKDVAEIERTLSLFVAFHPVNRTYENAALFLWRGLRKKNEAGELVYAIPQDTGKGIALEKVKEFARQFAGPVGMVLLYGYIEKGLVAAGYFGEEKKDATPVPDVKTEEHEQPKNLPKPTGKRGRKQRSG
jgi:hypothetical protein